MPIMLAVVGIFVIGSIMYWADTHREAICKEVAQITEAESYVYNWRVGCLIKRSGKWYTFNSANMHVISND